MQPTNYFAKFTDDELVEFAEELNQEIIPEDSKCREYAKLYFDNDNLISIIGLGTKLSAELAVRLKSFTTF